MKLLMFVLAMFYIGFSDAEEIQYEEICLSIQGEIRCYIVDVLPEEIEDEYNSESSSDGEGI